MDDSNNSKMINNYPRKQEIKMSIIGSALSENESSDKSIKDIGKSTYPLFKYIYTISKIRGYKTLRKLLQL